MGYNFPNSPSAGDTFAPTGGPVWRFDGFVWKQQAVDTIEEAPVDHSPYARQDAAWIGIPPPGTADWSAITGKPSTFPPTLPIAQSGVTNLVSDLAGKAPTVHIHAESDVTNLVADLAGKAPTVHTHTTAEVTGLDAALTARELTANKGAVSGYAPLDGSAKVPAINLPAYVDDVLEFADLAAFPATGTTGIIYVALDTNKVYRWGGSSYTEISPSPGSTDAVPEGSTNLYYTDARVAASPAVAGKADTSAMTAADNLRVLKAGDTMTGPLAIAAPSTVAGLNINTGTAPTTPLDGDIWITGGGTLSWRYGGNTTAGAVTIAQTQTISGAKTFSISPVLPTPAAGDNSTKGATTAYVDTADALRVLKAGDTMTGPLILPAGSSGTVSLQFGGGAGGGLYASGTGASYVQNFVVNSSVKLVIDQSQVRANSPFRAQDGAVGTPAISFTNDTDSGFYRGGAGDIRLSVDAADVAKFLGSDKSTTLSGNLTIDKTNPTLVLNKTNGNPANIDLKTGGLTRWRLNASSGIESTGNVGSDFFLYRFDDAGAQIDFPLWVQRSTGVSTFSGDLILAKVTPTIEIQKAASGQEGALIFRTGSAAAGLRWKISSDTLAEGGANAGSQLAISRYDDAGVKLNDPIQFTRDTGRITFNTTAGGVVSNSTGVWSFGSKVNMAFATAIPAGGSLTVVYAATSTANFGVFFGSGVPTISAAKGSLYLRSDGSTTNDRMYVNTNGSTTWTAVNTVA